MKLLQIIVMKLLQIIVMKLCLQIIVMKLCKHIVETQLHHYNFQYVLELCRWKAHPLYKLLHETETMGAKGNIFGFTGGVHPASALYVDVRADCLRNVRVSDAHTAIRRGEVADHRVVDVRVATCTGQRAGQGRGL